MRCVLSNVALRIEWRCVRQPQAAHAGCLGSRRAGMGRRPAGFELGDHTDVGTTDLVQWHTRVPRARRVTCEGDGVQRQPAHRRLLAAPPRAAAAFARKAHHPRGAPTAIAHRPERPPTLRPAARQRCRLFAPAPLHTDDAPPPRRAYRGRAPAGEPPRALRPAAHHGPPKQPAGCANAFAQAPPCGSPSDARCAGFLWLDAGLFGCPRLHH